MTTGAISILARLKKSSEANGSNEQDMLEKVYGRSIRVP